MAGCTPFDSMRQSTLECLYSQTCVDAIALQPNISHPKALNQSLTRFPLDIKVGDLFDRYLFVESWQNQSNFENYYSSCSPRTLSYSYQRRFHLAKLFILVFAAHGALVIVLQIFTPIVIQTFSCIQSKKFDSSSERTSTESEVFRVTRKKVHKGTFSIVQNKSEKNFLFYHSRSNTCPSHNFQFQFISIP